MKVAHVVTKQGEDFILKSKEGQVVVGPEHKKYEWVAQLPNDQVVNISATGRWTASKDYKGITAQIGSKPKSKLKVKLTHLDDLKFSDDLFKPVMTGTVVDKFLSTDGGFMPGSNIMAAGAPGVGKTTVLLELLSRVVEADPNRKVLFISAEMNQLDMARYLKRFPHWGRLPILFMADYADENPQAVVEAVLNQGWDLVLTDSYTEVNDQVKEECGITRSKAEKWFLDLMTSHNKGLNRLKKYTTFITILQLSKGGTFVGSNKLKHMTSAMMHIDWKGAENSAERYMEFSKNRLGQVGQPLFFSFTNGVEFDAPRWTRDLLNQELVQAERDQINKESDHFDRLFASWADEAEEGSTEGVDSVQPVA